jgi:hypothetical protein
MQRIFSSDSSVDLKNFSQLGNFVITDETNPEPKAGHIAYAPVAVLNFCTAAIHEFQY